MRIYVCMYMLFGLNFFVNIFPFGLVTIYLLLFFAQLKQNSAIFNEEICSNRLTLCLIFISIICEYFAF